jgi:hypothetical protein
MTTDLETRLRRYGATLDHAASPQPSRAAAPLRRVHESGEVELELSRVSDHPRRRARSLIAAAGLVAAASVAFVAVVTQRGTEPSAPATSPDNGPDSLDARWPVQLADGITPWFEVDDDTVTALQLQPAEPGPAQQRLRCTDWTADRGTVTCNTLRGEGYLPAVTHPGTPGTYARYVDVSTLHDAVDAATYATNYSQGKDVGYEDTPLPQQDVTVNGAPGRLIETDNGIRRVTWSPQPGTLVAVESGPGLTRDDLLTIADHVTPTTTQAAISLVLAATETDPEGRQAVALGGVIDGEICLTTTGGCEQVLPSTPEPGTVAAAAIYSQPTDFGIAGIATGDIATIRASRPDGTTTDVTLARQPIGTTHAFALVTDTAVTLTAFNTDGTPIENIEVTTAPRPDETVPTTIYTTTPPSASTPTPSVPGRPIPSEVLDQIGAGDDARLVLTLDGVSLFVATPDDTTTCLIVDTGDGYPAGCSDNRIIAGGEYWQLSRERPDSPNVLAGFAPDDVVRVIVNGADALMSQHAWMVVSDDAITSYTLVSDDGTTQTVELSPGSSVPANSVPGSTTPPISG